MDTLKVNQLNLVGTWFGACFFSLIFSILLLVYLSTSRLTPVKNSDFKLYAALPGENIEFTDTVISQDARGLIIKNYFSSKNSDLAAMATDFVEEADKYGLDYRLLPAIAMQESNGGKKIPDGSFNPFGYGIYGSKAVYFENWEEAIEVVAKSLREDYLNQGLDTPYEIMTKYTPPSIEKGGPWAKGVTHFMEELR